MADTFALTVAGTIVGQLSSPAVQAIGRLWGLDDELERLRDTVSTIKAALLDADGRAYNSRTHSARNLIGRLKDALYDAEDLLGDFSVEARLRDLRSQNKIMKQVLTFLSSSNQLIFKVKMASRLKKLRMTLDNISSDEDFFWMLGEPRVECREEIRLEETHSHIPEGILIGRDTEKSHMVDLLLDSNTQENVSVISIVGMGGIGKTALAQSVYNDQDVQNHFELRMWVCVADYFRLDTIIRQIISRDENYVVKEYHNLDILQQRFRKEIKQKRFLLVLDDLWNEDRVEWDRLKRLLVEGAKGSRILVTTQNYKVAYTCDSWNPYTLQALSDGASLDLFMQVTYGKGQEITESQRALIGQEIIRKYTGGVPLSIGVIGGMLFTQKTFNDWLNIKNDVGLSQGVMNILRLSYDHLPSELKPCFALCSLFPKGNVIDKQKLIDLWTAHGLIPSAKNAERNLKVAGQDYIKDLLSRNLFQDKEVDDYGNVVSCKMHSLLHDLACHVAEKECDMIGPDTGSKEPVGIVRHLSYGSNDDLSRYHKSFARKVAKVRTLFFISDTDRGIGTLSVRTCHNLISNLRSLRFLTLHNTDMRAVPSSLCKLRLLHYLDLSYNEELKRLPKSIRRLQNLITIKLIGCHKLKKLPQDIGKLVSIQHLDLGYDSSLSHMPHGPGKLTSLCTLTHFIVGGSESNSKNCAKLGELKHLNSLRGKLDIIINGHVPNATFESKEAAMGEKKLLDDLILMWRHVTEKVHEEDKVIQNHEILLEGLQPHSNLLNLHIRDFKGASFPRWLMGDNAECLPNLTGIGLYGCERCQDLSQLSSLPKLKILTIIGLSAVESIGHPCPETSSGDLIRALPPFPSLLELKIHGCPRLKSMPQIQNLESLDLRNVSEELLNQSIPLHKLRSLRIERIEHLKRFGRDFLQNLISLAHMRICDCPSLTSISLGLERPWSLTHLTISNCAELDLSKDENGNVMQLFCLVKLRCLNLFGLPKLASLPGWLFHITTLEELQMWNCSNLTALSERIGDLVSLQRLQIHGCPNLESLPESIRKLTSLRYLEIEGCQQLAEKCKHEDGYKVTLVPEVAKSCLIHGFLCKLLPLYELLCIVVIDMLNT